MYRVLQKSFLSSILQLKEATAYGTQILKQPCWRGMELGSNRTTTHGAKIGATARHGDIEATATGVLVLQFNALIGSVP